MALTPPFTLPFAATAEATVVGNNPKKSRRRRGGRNKKKMSQNAEAAAGEAATRNANKEAGAALAAAVIKEGAETIDNEVESTMNLVEEAKQFANSVKGAEGGAEASAEGGLSEETKAKVEEAKERVMVALNKVRGTLDGLSEYQGQLRDWMDNQLMLENQMIEALENTRRTRARIQEEQERIAALQEQYDMMEPEQDGDGRQV